jgi:hypothetical protein
MAKEISEELDGLWELTEVTDIAVSLQESMEGLCRTIAGQLDACIHKFETEVDITEAVNELRRISRILKEREA